MKARHTHAAHIQKQGNLTSHRLALAGFLNLKRSSVSLIKSKHSTTLTALHFLVAVDTFFSMRENVDDEPHTKRRKKTRGPLTHASHRKRGWKLLTDGRPIQKQQLGEARVKKDFQEFFVSLPDWPPASKCRLEGKNGLEKHHPAI